MTNRLSYSTAICSDERPALSLMKAVSSVKYSLALDRLACLMYSCKVAMFFCKLKKEIIAA